MRAARSVRGRRLPAMLRSRRGERERGAALARRQQRCRTVAWRRPPARRAVDARLVARQRRLHAVEVADARPRRSPRACPRPQLLVGQGGAPMVAARRQQRAARSSARRSSSVSGGRLQRASSASAAAMRTAASSSSSSSSAGGRRSGACRVRSRGARPASASASTRDALSTIGQRHEARPPARWRRPRRTARSAPPSFCSRQSRPTSPTKSRPPRIVSSGSSVCRRGATP